MPSNYDRLSLQDIQGGMHMHAGRQAGRLAGREVVRPECRQRDAGYKGSTFQKE